MSYYTHNTRGDCGVLVLKKSITHGDGLIQCREVVSHTIPAPGAGPLDEAYVCEDHKAEKIEPKPHSTWVEWDANLGQAMYFPNGDPHPEDCVKAKKENP